MFDQNDEELIAHPELYPLLPKRSVKNRLLCLYLQAAYRGTFSWSIFKDRQRYVLRRLRTEPNEKVFQGLSIDILGAEKIISAAFAEAVQTKAVDIPPMEGGDVYIDGNHVILHIGPKRVVDFHNIGHAHAESKEAITSIMEELETVFGDEIRVRKVW